MSKGESLQMNHLRSFSGELNLSLLSFDRNSEILDFREVKEDSDRMFMSSLTRSVSNGWKNSVQKFRGGRDRSCQVAVQLSGRGRDKDSSRMLKIPRTEVTRFKRRFISRDVNFWTQANHRVSFEVRSEREGCVNSPFAKGLWLFVTDGRYFARR